LKACWQILTKEHEISMSQLRKVLLVDAQKVGLRRAWLSLDIQGASLTSAVTAGFGILLE